MELKTKTALITGGSSGIGLATAEILFNSEINTVIIGRREEKITKALSDIKQGDKTIKAEAIGLTADVTDYKSMERAVEKAVSIFGKIDVVFANAGFFKSAAIDDLSVELWDKTINTNLNGVFYTLKSCVEQLKINKGYFFAISSLMGKDFNKNCSAHTASKFGVTGFVQAAMLDLRQYGIKTSMLMPGSVATHYDQNTPEDEYKWKIQPEDIGELILNLLKMNRRSLPSKIEVRPSFPPAK